MSFSISVSNGTAVFTDNGAPDDADQPVKDALVALVQATNASGGSGSRSGSSLSLWLTLPAPAA